MGKKLKIGVVMGGMSAEYEISLQTGKHVIAHLDPDKYEIIPINISQENQWEINGSLQEIPTVLKTIDLIFNATHGTFGEDGRLQALFDFFNVPYTGSGVAASALAFDKMRSRDLFKFNEIAVPKSHAFDENAINDRKATRAVRTRFPEPPWVIKPVRSGSSMGISIAWDEKALSDALNLALEYDREVIVEEYLRGREFTCGVIENINGERYTALPVVEIIPSQDHEFFDYEAKYDVGTQEIVPAHILEDLEKKIQDVAIRAHKILGCNTYSRSDMIAKDRIVYLLETNTLPGLTHTSLYPKAAKAAGFSFPVLLDKIIEEARP